MVVRRIVDIAEHEAKVERHRQDDEKTEHDFFKVHE
jgi:hypothetical protein